MFKFHIKEKDFCLLFCFLNYPGWIDLAAKNERLFTCSCACVYICCCEWDMFVWLTLFWHWWWQIGQIFVVMLMMMIGWSNLFIIIDDDWMTIIAATWKRKGKFLHVIAAQVPCWFFAAFGRSRSILILPAKHDCCIWSWIILQDGPEFRYDVPVMMNQLWYTDCDNSANYLSIIIVLFIYFRSIGHGLVVLRSRFYSLVYSSFIPGDIISKFISIVLLLSCCFSPRLVQLTLILGSIKRSFCDDSGKYFCDILLILLILVDLI